MFQVCVPATSANLGPGFDCLGLALQLYNRLGVSSAGKLRIEVTGEGAEELSCSAENLVWQSACALYAEIGRRPEPIAISMQNAIPLGRGLGSSSAAIVAGLLVANRLTGEQLTKGQLLRLATKLEGHPDNVAPALYGGMVITAMQDELVQVLPFPFAAELQLVVCIPDFQLATSRARQVLPEMVAHRDAVFNLSRVALLLGAMLHHRHDLIGMGAADRLHQPYRLGLIPGGEQAQRQALQAGAAAAVISGAGPTMLSIVPPVIAADEVGRRMVAGFAEAGVAARHLVLPLDTVGARVIALQG